MVSLAVRVCALRYWRLACRLEEGINVKRPGTVIYFQSVCGVCMCAPVNVCVWADRINHFHFSELSLHSPCLCVTLWCGLAFYPLNFFPGVLTDLEFILLILTCTVGSKSKPKYSESLCALIVKQEKKKIQEWQVWCTVMFFQNALRWCVPLCKLYHTIQNTNYSLTFHSWEYMCVLLQVTWFLCNVLQLLNCGW